MAKNGRLGEQVTGKKVFWGGGKGEEENEKEEEKDEE